PGAGLAAAGASRLARTAERVRRAAALVAGVPAMQSLALSLQSKAERLADSRFTIALFGAFSAGKSSFANALIGERLLPVSPNPTTAAINTIVPPGESLPNHAARVRMKPEAVVFEEVKHSLDILGEPCSDWASALREIAALRPERVAAGGKPHYSFLKAVERGFATAQPLFGQELVVRQEEFASYVADEQKSCFVETIALAHDNELTRQGMTFVDTPGADSINARHTGVAFNYIKNADVILFVTYYNHAFSQADREFLLQLGRVKDSFELDKMFFVVNAADLASSRDELQAVVAHVEANLLQHGIRKARIYPLSSQQAVEAKQNGNAALAEASGIAAFERDFIRFTVGELSDIAIRAAELEMGRAALELDDWIESAQAGEEERARRLLTLENSHRQAIAGLERLWAEENRTPELLQEIDELLHYVKQRTMFRFGDFFTMSFHPSALQDDGRDMRKAMRGCMLELQRLLSYQLSQELLATTLRVENKMRRLLATRKNESTAAVREALATFRQEDDAMAAIPTPEVDETLAAKADEKWLAGFYRSGRQFFENGGKDRLRTELEAKLMEPIDAYMRKHAEQFAAYYAERLAAELLRQREQVLEAAFEHAASRKAALEMRVDLAGLARTRAALDELIASPEQE
uniref:dynamin family protein n=1 Tax=Paenibacillus cymbidii TaxID=1639034 RepID=UPI001A9A713B